LKLPYTFDLSTFDPEAAPSALVKAHADDAAYDLRATKECWVSPGETIKVETGLRLAIPEGYAGLVLSRSGLASKGIVVANAPGLIDPGYRGEVGVLLHNNKAPQYEIESGGTIGLSWSQPEAYKIEPGDRIAQLLFVPLAHHVPQLYPAADFEMYHGSHTRGEGGFGSTGR